MEGIAWLNGRLLSPDRATVSALDHGYLYGLGCFETVRLYQGRPFRLDRHVARLLDGARALGLPDAPAPHRVTEAVAEAVRAAGLASARVRFSLTPGPGEPTPDGRPQGPPSLLVLVLPLAEHLPAGVRLARAPWRVDSRWPLRGVKATAYAPYLLARRDARARGADDALLLNEREELVETTTSNLFLVRGGRLVTPDLESGPLPGIARAAVLEAAAALGLPVEERPVPAGELATADEAFVTNSVAEVVPVVEADGRPFPPGPVTGRLAAAYRELVRRETGAAL